MLNQLRRARLLVPTLFAGFGLMVLCALGSWQLQRMAWKQGLIATIAQRVAASPLTNADWAAAGCLVLAPLATDTCEYRRVRLSGRFRHDEERHVFIHVGRGASGVGGTGYWIFTPFELDAPASGSVYVNRGFVPEALKGADRRTGMEGMTVVEGQLRRPEPRAWFTATNDPAKNVWFLRNPRDFAGGQPPPGRALDVYIEATGEVVAGRVPAPIAGRIEIPNRHFEYALTWFGLAEIGRAHV